MLTTRCLYHLFTSFSLAIGLDQVFYHTRILYLIPYLFFLVFVCGYPEIGLSWSQTRRVPFFFSSTLLFSLLYVWQLFLSFSSFMLPLTYSCSFCFTIIYPSPFSTIYFFIFSTFIIFAGREKREHTCLAWLCYLC